MNTAIRAYLFLTNLFIVLGLIFCAPASAQSFAASGNMVTARDGQMATLLPDGQVLLAGGSDTNGNVLASAELYSPSTGAFTSTGSMNTGRIQSTATLLDNGLVLIVGGADANYNVLASAELYNPATGTFSLTGSLNAARYAHTATLLSTGMVLIAGGADANGDILSSAELYDPATGTFSNTGTLTIGREFHTATALDNGQVLLVGGFDSNYTVDGTAEIYDPVAGTFAATGNLNTARFTHTATLLNDGTVLIAGGYDVNYNTLSSAEIFSTGSGAFSTTGSLIEGRGSPAATLMTNGQVLFVGGTDQGTNVADAELYDPATHVFSASAAPAYARYIQTATLLSNGTILEAGGCDAYGNAFGSSEPYTPATLTPSGLVSISLTPASASINVGASQSFVATATFSDNSTETLVSAFWSSSNSAAATVSNDSTNQGQAFGVSPGSVTIAACTGSICGSTALTVASSVPTISSLSVNSGPVWTEVTVTGTNFDSTQGNSTVSFGGVVAPVSSWSSSSIIAEVPNTAPPGVVQVTVTTTAGTSAPQSFTVVPQIAALSPNAGPVGASIAIEGNNFGSPGTVSFDGIEADVTSWTSNSITATVPQGVTSGNVIVTTDFVVSNAVAFSVAQPASVTGISVNSGAAFTSVTISGSNFGASQGNEAGNVAINGAYALVTSWGATSITALVPMDADPGLGSLTVTLGGLPSNSFAFTVIPSLTTPDSSAVPGEPLFIVGADLGSSPGSISLAGASPQIVSWTTAGVTIVVPPSQPIGTALISAYAGGITTNTENYSVMPGIMTISPAAAQAGATVTIAGAGLGSSGSVTFNGVSAPIESWSSTSITTQVPDGATSGPIVATVSNDQTNAINFTVQPAQTAPSSIVIQPASALLGVGVTRTLLAVDSNGNTISNASWTVDNQSLVSISTDVPPVLTALAAGTITLTATYESLSAQATWNIYASTPSDGTAEWSLPSDGLTFQGLVQAIPIGAGADLFSLESTSDLTSWSVRASAIDGGPTWTAVIPPLPAATGYALPDANGGLILDTQSGEIRLDGVTGQQDWVYSDPSGEGMAPPASGATGPNGIAYQLRGSSTSTDIVALDVSSGQQQFAVELPSSYMDEEFSNQEPGYIGPIASEAGPISIMPDGTAVLEVLAENVQARDAVLGVTLGYCPTNISFQLYLVTINPDGTSSSQQLDSFASNQTVPGICYGFAYATYGLGQVIPDGNGGLLASWEKNTGLYEEGSGWADANLISHVSGGAITTYSLPYHFEGYGGIYPYQTGNLMILGDNGTVFATDPTSQSVLFAFDENTGTIKWAYPQTGLLSLIAASDGGGVVAKSTVNGMDTVLRFDPSGNVTADAWTASNIINFGGDFWEGAIPALGVASGISAAPIDLGASPWALMQVARGGSSTPQVTIDNFSQGPPPSDRNQAVVNGIAQELITALSSSNFAVNSTCKAWIQSGPSGTGGTLPKLQNVLNNNSFGHGVLNTAGKPNYVLAAVTFPNGGGPSGIPRTVVTVVNDNGLWFHSIFPIDAIPFEGNEGVFIRGADGTSHFYPGNSTLGQAANMLHEFGHIVDLGLPFQQNDDDATLAASRNNDFVVDQNCRNMIEALPSITSVSPGSGSPGNSSETITGTNLGSSQAAVQGSVAFTSANGTTQGTVGSWTEASSVTTITVSVPSNAINGPIVVTVNGIPATWAEFTAN